MDDERGSGWLVFASIVLVVAGVMRIFDAIWAWRYDGAEELQELLLGSEFDTYGWLWFIVGIVLIGAGVLVFAGSQLARWIGIAAGAVMAISAISWMPVYPVWSLVYTLVGFFVIYGLAVYGGRPHAER